jgi:hypothetical protein
VFGEELLQSLGKAGCHVERNDFAARKHRHIQWPCSGWNMP